ncbi:MAG: hypothetical protein UT24_C0008G0051 [Candidatus Woesebacteria bacterium GW2011_GWB1_39_12]|uniref:Uncharacterized protein n=2 Tax=Candidatus Woeseibacteriota TaxID=1752722 RepID=A0A0G0PH43_9BACT|nr:MAG: hypothetical protein UT23_C0012G0049 [Candidatus Woesebacteria bacterium GW2011_GWA1_39_12]KKR00923.1 MAG: hypothetical protein UT24_C0008G0051 [Candidatus Woesebacteria bacterium GW2011_GWB1_39_12]
MVVERLEAQGIKTAGALFKGLFDSGLSGKISSELYYHEKAHADADVEGCGEFGFAVTSGWVIAYYIINGERDPQELMKIASAPGFSNMSSKDWEVYNRAWKDWLRHVAEEKYQRKMEGKPEAYSELRSYLTKLLTEKLDKYSEEGRFPKLEELFEHEYSELWQKFGNLLYQAYKEVSVEFQIKIGEGAVADRIR